MTDSVRYILHPMKIYSASDGDVHFVGVAQLRQLYQVPPSARVLIRPAYGDEPDRLIFDAMYHEQPGDIHCYPRYSHTEYPFFKEAERQHEG